ncbi:glutaredoxin [Halopseudomonas pachastrellae]|nr:glutaredoxin [Halopseudomonas pachastrellae]
MSALKHAKLYRMVMPDHTCPYGLKSLDLLKRKGYKVEDKHLASREQTDAFKQEHGVETTPQTFIDGRRIGGYDELRKFFDMPVKDKNAVTYTPVVALFLMAAALALGASWALRPATGHSDRRVVRGLCHVLAGVAETQERGQFRDDVPQL